MEFKFRAIDEQPPAYRVAQSSRFSYFTEQAIRAGIPSNKFGSANEFFRDPIHMREEIQRELEKEQIREEIIAAEIARKRVLEAEVRREMMMEREMGVGPMSLRGRADGFSLFPHRVDPRFSGLHPSEGSRSLEERIALSLEERHGYGLPARREIGGFEKVPFQSNSEPKISDIKDLHEAANKEKFIILGKPCGNLSGVKRKAVTPPATDTSELSVGSKKKPKEEWSCAICQVRATSEKGLNEHLGGKKHQAKEAALRAQKTGTNLGLGVFQKKTAKPLKVAEIADNPSSEQRAKTGKKLPLLHIKNAADDAKKEDGKTGESMKKNFRFWCEMCQAGAYSEKVMNNHKRGKKHTARLRELELKEESASKTQKLMEPGEVSEEETKKAKDTEEVAEVETMEAKDSEVVAEEEAIKGKGSEDFAEEETKTAVEKVDGVEVEGHQEAAEVFKSGSL